MFVVAEIVILIVGVVNCFLMSLFAIFVGPGPVFVSSAHDACSTVLGEG